MNKVLSLVLLSISSISFAKTQSELNFANKVLKNIKGKASLSYGLTYLGPSLSSDYQEGATFNHYNTGQDFKGDDVDPTSSEQLYHSFSVGYQISKNVKLGYSYTFQDDLNSNVDYNVYNADGSIFAVNQRERGLSYNNQRISAFVTNIYSNKYFFLMSNFYYERPTTEGSIDGDMLYGLGVQPTIGFFSSIPKTYFGIKGSIERDYYKRQEYTYNCGGSPCTQKYQTFRVSLTPYIGYNYSDSLRIDAKIIFDWDQDGDQVETSTYSKNMDNILEVTTTYTFSKNVNIGTGIRASIDEPGFKRSALIGNLNLSL